MLNSGYYPTLTMFIGVTTDTSHWNITTAISVRVRTDTGRINTPPVANMVSPRGIPRNVPTQIVIPTSDVDTDDDRCRWGNSSLERGNVCFLTMVSSSTSLSRKCMFPFLKERVNQTGNICLSVCMPIQPIRKQHSWISTGQQIFPFKTAWG